MKSLSYFSLGATLYTPCTHPNLNRVMQQGLGARSMVFCTEDSVNPEELPIALDRLAGSLRSLQPNQHFLRFIRPRNPDVLDQILMFSGIEKIDGFVLPKADLDTIPKYREVLKKHQSDHALMPTLESIQVLDPALLPKIRHELDQLKANIVCLRIGGNDLMNLMGLKRLPGLCAYDTPLRMVIEQLLLTFRPHGYEISAPVFDFIDDRTTLSQEVVRDISYGMYAKTAIHPNQLAIIEEQYTRYTQLHIEQAQAVADVNAKAVFKYNGQMMERTCHAKWAERTLALAENFHQHELAAANG